MSNFNERLANIHDNAVLMDDLTPQNIITITASREFDIPADFNRTIAYVGDVNSQIISFKIPQYQDGHDLYQCQKRKVRWINLSNGFKGTSDLEVANDCYQWYVPATLFTHQGIIEFSIIFYDLGDNGEVGFSWNTSTCAELRVEETSSQQDLIDDFPTSNKILLINHETRKIIAPRDFNNIIATQGDKNVSSLYFQAKRFVYDIDLLDAKTEIKIFYAHSKVGVISTKENISVKQYTSSDDNQKEDLVLISWAIPNEISSSHFGNLPIAISFSGKNRVWNSVVYSSLTINSTIITEAVLPNPIQSGEYKFIGQNFIGENATEVSAILAHQTKSHQKWQLNNYLPLKGEFICSDFGDNLFVALGNGENYAKELLYLPFGSLTGRVKTNNIPSVIYYYFINPTLPNDSGVDNYLYDFYNIRFTANPTTTYKYYEKVYNANGVYSIIEKTETRNNESITKSQIYSYPDIWGHTRYTFDTSYTPNIKEGENAISLEVQDDKLMWDSIILEAHFGQQSFTQATKNASLISGENVIANGKSSVAVGAEQLINGYGSASFGRNNFIRNNAAMAFGYNNVVTAPYGVAVNEGNKVTGYASFCCGDHNTIASSHSFGTGWQNLSSGQYNFVGGSRNILEGSYNTGFGDCNKYSGQHNFGLGKSCEINGLYNIINGYNIKVFGGSNIVNGLNNSIGGVIKVNDIESQLISSYNIIVGIGNKITRTKAVDDKGKTLSSLGHIINGVNNEIKVEPSYRNFVNGEDNTIDYVYKKGKDEDGNDIDVIDTSTTVKGSGYSIVSGIKNFVRSRFGVALGEGLEVQGHYGTQLAIGKYNQIDKWAMFVIGQGESETNRKNIFTVKNDGRGIFTGTVTAATPTLDTHLTTKKYVDDLIKKASGLPQVTATDNGKFLRVVGGKWQPDMIYSFEETMF